MRTLTLPPSRAAATILRCRPAVVHVQGRRRRDLEVLTWEAADAPDFGKVVLCLGRAGVFRQIDDVGRLPPIGAEVAVRADPQTGGGEFLGLVAAHRREIDGDGERQIVEVEHRLAGALRGTLSSRLHIESGRPVEVENAKVVFNGGPSGLASAEPVTVGSREVRVFDSAASAGRWSVADALSYLIASALPQGVAAPTAEELEGLAGQIDLGDLDATGLTVAQALAQAAARGGLAVRAAREGLGLVFYRPGREGRVACVRLQPPGAALSPAGSNLWRGTISTRRRPGRRGVLALGGLKRYESTFELNPGWDGALQTRRWRDFVRSESADWPAVADVYRRWVLNEHGRYAGPPWDLATHDFSDISPGDFFLHAPRRFLPCLSADRCGGSLGVVVEVRCGYGQPWRRWTGPVWASAEQCAVYLGGDALPADFFRSAVEDEASVRVTATVEADARLAAEVAGDAGRLRRVLDLSDRAGWAKVHSGSIFHGAAGLGQPDERDDADLLARLALPARRGTGGGDGSRAGPGLGGRGLPRRGPHRARRRAGAGTGVRPHGQAMRAPRAARLRAGPNHNADRERMTMTRTSGYHDALGRLAQGGSYTGARLVRITALQGGNRYDARAVEFAEDGSTQFATEATFTVTNLAEPADQDGRVPDQTDAVALDVEGRWVVFVRPPTAGVFPARVVSALNNAVYAVREQAPGEDGSFVDKQGAPELNAQNLAELSLGPGAALEAGTIVLVTALTDEGPPPAVRYVFDHPAYAKYLD